MVVAPDPFSADTIAAIATAPGRGAVALVRISGPAAISVLETVCPGLRGQLPPARTARLITIRHPDTGAMVDRALVTCFPRPDSYTGDDSVEISTHGGVLTPQLVLDATLAAGARMALPGEFTRRALHNGKIDLAQAEATLDLVNGTSPALHRAAIHQLERGLSRRIEELRAGILRAEALVAYGIDFPDEDEPPVPPAQIVGAVESVAARIESMLATAPQGELLREGALVVLAGYPNAGKSSLFNALVGFERSIVTDIPGTTRDAVEVPITIRGFPFKLVDTAGLRVTDDVVEGLGVEVAHRYLDAADLVLYCADGGAPLDTGDVAFLESRPSRSTLLVRTKADLTGAEVHVEAPEFTSVPVSVVTGKGLDTLADHLVDHAFQGVVLDDRESPLITRGRHARALREAAAELTAFLAALTDQVPVELAATHLRGAASALEEIVGAIVTDDVLGAIFEEFCVGK